MINKQRVRRIKNLIYAFVILVLFLPLIFMSILSLRMIDRMKNMSEQLDDLRSTVSQISPPSVSGDDSGYVIEPEEQTARGDASSPQNMEGTNAGSNEASSNVSGGETTGTNESAPEYLEPEDFAPEDFASESGDSLSGEFQSVGSGSGINGVQSGTVDAKEGAAQSDGSGSVGTGGAQSGFNSGNVAGAQGKDQSGNPQTGNPGQDTPVPLYDPNGNPLTGR